MKDLRELCVTTMCIQLRRAETTKYTPKISSDGHVVCTGFGPPSNAKPRSGFQTATGGTVFAGNEIRGLDEEVSFQIN